GDRVGLSLAELHDQSSARRQQPRRVVNDDAISVETVGAAIERKPWIVISHLRRELADVVARNVGRIGDDEVEWSAQRGRIFTRDELAAVRKAEPLCVGTRYRQSINAFIGGYACCGGQLG